MHASSLLASRAQPGTVFLIIDGALHIMTSRCRDDGSDWLTVMDGDAGTWLDVQPAPRAPRQQWRVPDTARVHDVSWNPGDTGSALALITCDQQAP